MGLTAPKPEAPPGGAQQPASPRKPGSGNTSPTSPLSPSRKKSPAKGSKPGSFASRFAGLNAGEIATEAPPDESHGASFLAALSQLQAAKRVLDGGDL